MLFSERLKKIRKACGFSQAEVAQALDIDKMCRLKVKYNDGREEYISSGEVSIRI